MRIIKDHSERKTEILDTAAKLFTTKGYHQTTIIDILNAIGIAKGTFYYYFKSKEEVMDAIIMRVIAADVIAAQKIADTPGIPAIEKLFQILMVQKPQNGDTKGKMIDQFHAPNNAEMHQKSIVQSILQITPVITQVVEQGIREKVITTDYPQETVEFLLVSAQFIFDQGMFHWQPDEAARKVAAFISIMESVFNTDKGTFDEMRKIIT